MEEFINLLHGSISENEYALKFTLLFRYAQPVVADSKAKMSRFLTSTFELV